MRTVIEMPKEQKWNIFHIFLYRSSIIKDQECMSEVTSSFLSAKLLKTKRIQQSLYLYVLFMTQLIHILSK